MPKIESPLMETEHVPRVRDAQLTFKEGYTSTGFKSGNLRFLGRTKGFPLYMTNVPHDPYVMDEVIDIFGGLPAKYRGWTRSGASQEKLHEGIFRYDHVYPDMPNGDIYLEQAISHAFARFRFGTKVKPLDFWDVPVEANTSAGWTWLGKRKKDVYRSAVHAAKRMWKLNSQGKLSKRSVAPCCGYKRTQLAKLGEEKVRLVWGFPMEQTIREGRFVVPLVDLFERSDSPVFHGRVMLKELPAFIDSLFVNDGTAFVTDWSGFDATVPPWLIRTAFKICLQNLDLDTVDYNEYWNLCDYFIKTPIVMNNGDVFVKSGGIPSGSYFTQMIGSICNYILLCYLMLKTLGRFCKLKVLGDDSVGRLRKYESVDFEVWRELALKTFNMTLSAKKSIIATKPSECDFLGHRSLYGKVSRPEDRLVLLALYPEYPTISPEIATARVMGLLMDSGFSSSVLLAVFRRLESKFGIARELNEKFLQYVVQGDVSGSPSDGEIWINSGS